MKEGGTILTGFGNANYIKTTASYSTGKMENGLSASVLLGQTLGDGYVDGTKFQGYNYFVGLGYNTSDDKHSFQFTFTGAPQWHNQRSNAPTIATYRKYGTNNEPDIRYNSDWGYLNGEEYSFRTSYYHKPVMSLNWDYNINDKMKLSSVVYGSWGRGGATNGAGAIRGNRFFADPLKTANGLINVDLIRNYNSGMPVVINNVSYTRAKINGLYESSNSTSNNSTNGISQIVSVNSHNWYGAVGSKPTSGTSTQKKSTEQSQMTTSQQSFFNKILPAIQQVSQKNSIVTSVMLAQSILESGWGTSQLATNAYNIFGIKADSSWKGNTYTVQTKEVVNGKTITVEKQFRAYKSLLESISDYGSFFTSTAWRMKNYASFLQATNYETALTSLLASGYATDPAYAEKLKSLIQRYSLDQYDLN